MINILSKDRVRDLEYAQDALKTDILQGFRLSAVMDFWDNSCDDETAAEAVGAKKRDLNGRDMERQKKNIVFHVNRYL